MFPQPDLNYTKVAKTEFQDIGLNDWRVEIWRRGLFTGIVPVREYTATGEPLRITQLSSGDAFYAPIKPSEAIIEIFNKEDFAAIRLYSTNNRSHKALIYRNETLIWTGFIQSDIWNEPLTTTPYPSTISFVDGLTMLKNIDFEFPGGGIWYGYVTPIYMIAYILAPLRLGRDIVDCLNYTFDETSFTYWSNEPHRRFSFLSQTRLNMAMFEGLTYYEALEKLLSSFNARIEYHENKYWIKPLVNEGKFFCTRYDFEANFIDTFSLDAYQVITKATEAKETKVCWVNGGQQLDVTPGWRSFDYVMSRQKRESMFWPWKFDDDAWINETTLRNSFIEGAKRSEVDGQTCLEMPERIQGQVVPDGLILQYTNEWYDYEELAQVAIDLSFRIGTLKPTERKAAEYFGPRGGVASGTGNVYYTNPNDYKLIYREATLFALAYPESPPYQYQKYYINIEGLTTDFVAQEKNFIIFIDPNNLPTGIIAGKFYSLTETLILVNEIEMEFQLSDFPITNTRYKPIWADVKDNQGENRGYPIAIIPNAHVMTFANFRPNTLLRNNLNIEGKWSTSDYLSLQINAQSYKETKFIPSGTTSTETAPHPGRFEMRIRKPWPVQFFREPGRQDVRGSVFFDQVTAVLTTALEDEKETVINNDLLNIEHGEIVQHIATMKDGSTLEKNAALKYKNGIFLDVPSSYFTDQNLAIIQALRLKKYDPATKVLGSETTLNDMFKDLYSVQYSRPRFILTGDISSEIILPTNKTFYERFTKKVYSTIGFEFAVKNCIFETELHEIGISKFDPDEGEFNEDFDIENEFA
jgi:hypothetical protein